ncbi:MAG: glycosyltransferase family 1 protein [Pseudomonadota bacterium]|uniref:glycosyltransferase family 4 protein n=1 Tax=Sphingobium yanoikuyae TaxID=13690 RepID=UPI00137827B0|nr:glycosyltransferase family 1 protein [Sphingobium yanoikuyae]NBB39201.1 glycosyltransferase [Sphingobium yanoikuyae]
MTLHSPLSSLRAHIHAALPVATAPASSRPLKIALFSGNYDCVRDGANRALNRLVRHMLDEHGAEVRIYSPTAPTPAFASVGDVRSVRSLCIPGRPEYRLAVGLTRAARADLEAFQPDIVHLSAPDLLGRQALNWARRNAVPTVASLHTRFETYLAYYRLGFLRRQVVAYLDRFYGDCDRILAPTPPIAADLAAIHGAERITLWSRGVDRSVFHPAMRDESLRAQLGYAPDDVVPLFFGRLVREKGLDIFADAIMTARASGLSLRPLILGDGPARDALARHLPNAGFAGHVEGARLGALVASADILVNPSVTEAFGNVNLEAMASGLAVLSADVPSASALIDNGVNGLLVPPGDVGAYARGLASLVRDTSLRRRLGHAAEATAGDYRWDHVLDSVARVYRELAGAPME